MKQQVASLRVNRIGTVMVAWPQSDDAIVLEAGRNALPWVSVPPKLATPRSAKACSARWRVIATEQDHEQRMECLPPSAIVAMQAAQDRRSSEMVHWPKVVEAAPFDGVFADDPRAVRDKGSPDPQHRFSARAPAGIPYGGSSSLCRLE